MSTVYADAGRVLTGEFDGATLGDARRFQRLMLMADRMERRPAAGFPEMMGSSADLEGCYRLLNNDAVTMEDLLEPHIDNTAKRAGECDEVLAIHDETTFRFDHADQREAVGQLRSGGPGFYGRFSLLVDAEQQRRPLGVSDASIYLRNESWEPAETQLEGVQWDEGETEWWLEHVDRTERRVPNDESVIHVMDANFEAYDRLDALESRGSSFVARLSCNRKVRREGADEWRDLREFIETLKVRQRREVEVSSRTDESRPPEQLEKHPPRKHRQAEVKLGAATVELRRPRKGAAELPAAQTFQLVYAWEEETEEGVEPIEWILLTNLEVETAEDLAKVVDIYEGRWRIEQFHKALKTGCGFKDRQLENRRALLNALAMSLPMAWLLLAVRSLARVDKQMPARWIIDDVQLEVLRELGPRSIDADNPTAQEVIGVIAQMGGHWPSNGPPGWQVLSRGLRKLITLTQGWQAARAKM